MSKINAFLLLVIISLFALVGCTGNGDDNATVDDGGYTATVVHELSEVATLEEKKSFSFFWSNTVLDESSPAYGLISDRYPSSGNASIASVGFGLAAIPVAIENGWIKSSTGEERVLKTLKSMEKLQTKHGFYYHFYSEKTGNPSPNSEVSDIDTGIMLCGMLFCGQYFGGEIKEIANRIYDRVEWTWFINPKTNLFYMSYDANKDKLQGAWDVYAEQLMLYFLAAGSKTYPIEKKVYDAFRKNTSTYGEYQVIYSWFGSIFTYQFSHSFIDFRNMNDSNGINWYDNSVNATLAAHQYAVDQSVNFKTFGNLSWGMTACDGPNGYNGYLGSSPSGSNSTAHKNDGTVALSGAIGSMPFAPELVSQTMDNYYTILDGKLFGKFGFVDSYNLENGTWIADSYIGIDKGVTILMLENYRSELIWKVFMDTPFMSRAIEVLGFTNK